MTTSRRSWGTRWTWRDRASWAWHNLIPLAAVGLAFYAVWNTGREGAERRDQVCVSAERAHLASVDALRRTYDYLQALTPAQRREPLNAFLLRLLPQTEAEASTDLAPAFCDEPGVGLPEPDPKVPERPPSLDTP